MRGLNTIFYEKFMQLESKYARVYTTKDDKSIYIAFKSDESWEYKKGLDYEDLIAIKHTNEENVVLKSAVTTMTFNIDKGIELELPKRPPKPKREGYA